MKVFILCTSVRQVLRIIETKFQRISFTMFPSGITDVKMLLIFLPLVIYAAFVTAEVTITSPQSTAKTVIVNETFFLSCEASDGAHVRWRHNGTYIEQGPRYTITHHPNPITGVRVSYLGIPAVQITDSGKYECVDNPSSIFGKDEVTLLVTTEDKGVQVDITEPISNEIRVASGKSLTIKCVGTYRTNITWYLNGRELHGGPSLKTTFTRAVDPNREWVKLIMTLRRVSNRDAGKYACVDMRDGRNKDELNVIIQEASTGQDPVEIVEPPGSLLKVTIGQGFRLHCRTLLTNQLTWFLNNTLASFMGTYKFKVTEETVTNTKLSMLIRERATQTDTGHYMCRNSDNRKEADSVFVQVVNNEPVPSEAIIPATHHVVDMEVGAQLTLHCSYEGQGESIVQWSRDGEVLPKRAKYNYHINREVAPSMLEIRSARVEDSGTYRCTFKERHTGRHVAIIEFQVRTKPCPPLRPPINGSFDKCSAMPVFGESCMFQCQHAYRLTMERPLRCLKNESGYTYWSAEVPQCKSVEDAEFAADVPTSTSHVLMRLGNVLKLQCSANATWTRDGKLLPPINKYILDKNSLIINNTTKADVGFYNCNIKRKDSGALLGIEKFNVTTLDCPKMVAPHRGYMENCSSRPVYGESCTFRCEKGLRLLGSRSRTCELSLDASQPDLFWTGEPPSCHEAHMYPDPLFGSNGASHSAGHQTVTLGALCFVLYFGCWRR